MKYIVTHPGPAHRDDFMVCCIALFIEGATTIVRREPSEAELDDPDVLVLDVGDRHEPELNNFDHHQLPREHAPECALTLYCKARGIHDMLALRKWYNVTALIDSKGPYDAARVLELPRFPFELSSPVEAALLERFENTSEFSPADDDILGQLMTELGQSTLNYAKRAKAEYDDALQCSKTVVVNGVQAILWECETPAQAQAVRDNHYPKAAIALSHDDRGEGWSLYRFNDHPNVDFSLLEKDSAVLFAHKGGFIAKTRERLEKDELIELCARALRTRRWLVTEWDDSTDFVETLHEGDDVLMRYDDGTVHRVHHKHFESLKPVPVE